MSEDDVLFGYRLQLFEHAARVGVAPACRTFGVHRSTYYRWKRQVDRFGLEVLRPRERRFRNAFMEQDDTPLSGEVESDSAYVGGQLHEGERSRLRAEGRSNQGPATKDRAVVFAAVERKGRMRASVVGTSRAQLQATDAIRNTLCEFVLPSSLVFTDDWSGYKTLAGRGRYTFRRVRHSQRIYVSGNVHTNTVEGFFGHFKTALRGRHHSVSRRWLGSYLNEWVWKWNHRDDDAAMFRQLLSRAAGGIHPIASTTLSTKADVSRK